MQRHFSKYTKRLVPIARVLRRGMTDAERKLWSLLRNDQLGVKFRRQFPLGKFILDFYSHEARLDVEIDGSQHYTNDGVREDDARDNELHQKGIKVLRFSNVEALEETEAVVDSIFDEVQRRTKEKAGDEDNG